MARTGFFHHIGTFFLFAATILLIITDISAPVVSSISLLRIEIGTTKDQDLTDQGNFPSITFGTFGYCLKQANDGGHSCSDSMIGYDPLNVVSENINGIEFSDAGHATAKALTKVMVLHPVATGLAFICFLLSAGAGFLGSFTAAIGSFVTFIVVAVVVITDFVGFQIVHHDVNKADSRVNAQYGPAIWTTLAAGILCLLATILLLFTCCSTRLHHQRERKYRDDKMANSQSPPRRRFF
ncbi:pali-domain-containing protein [Xylariaceae sp. FL1019]|nr:pali-domain-containing protein [Xylariaceae sp. FL1019]